MTHYTIQAQKEVKNMQNGKTDTAPQLYVTTNYKQFKMLGGNRAIFERHYESLAKAIAKQNLLAFNPIIVNEKLEVIDGQHRLKVASDNNLPVYYIILAGATLNTVQALNSNMRPWTLGEYVNSFAGRGYKPYIKLKEFAKEYGLGLSIAALLLRGEAGGGRTPQIDSLHRHLRNGTFEIKLAEEAENIASVIAGLNAFKSGPVDRPYVQAIRRLYVEDPGLLKKLAYKLEHSGREIERKSTVKDYLRQFEDILNWKTQEKNLVRLY